MTTDIKNAALRTVTVSTSTQLITALANAIPGDLIQLTDGIYSGKFVMSKSGTEENRITLSGSNEAVLDSGKISEGYVLHFTGVHHCNIVGITVRNGKKGIMLDGSSHNIIDGVIVTNIGEEAVHFRNKSSYNTIKNSLITETGKKTKQYGEGVYIGSSKSNLVGDTCDYNNVIGNTIGPGVTAEMIDIKEYTAGGLIEGNTFYGDDLSGGFADSWIDVKGNNFVIRNNYGFNTLLDGFQTHILAEGWGNNNIFDGNVLNVNNSKGHGIKVDQKSSGNVVYCNNVVIGAIKLSNIECVARGRTPVDPIIIPDPDPTPDPIDPIDPTDPDECTAKLPNISLRAQDKKVTPGKSFDCSIKISNKDDRDCPEDTFSVFVTAPTGFSFTINQSKVVIEPRDTKTVKMTVTVPENFRDDNYKIIVRVERSNNISKTAELLLNTRTYLDIVD